MTFGTIPSHFMKTRLEPRTTRGLFFINAEMCFNTFYDTQNLFSALSQAIFETLLGNLDCLWTVFLGKLKYILYCFKTLKTDFQHYPKPFGHNTRGNVISWQQRVNPWRGIAFATGLNTRSQPHLTTNTQTLLTNM